MDSWERDLAESSRIFFKYVWPVIRNHCGGGKVIPVEGIQRELEEALDQFGGIDVLQIIPGKGVRGIASRVQFDKLWRTFTVRKDREDGVATEYEKRREAIESGLWIYPQLSVHAYASQNRLLGCAVAKTTDLYSYIKAMKVAGTPPVVREAIDTNTGKSAWFYAVEWSSLRQWCQIRPTHLQNLPVFTYEGSGTPNECNQQGVDEINAQFDQSNVAKAYWGGRTTPESDDGSTAAPQRSLLKTTPPQQ